MLAVSADNTIRTWAIFSKLEKPIDLAKSSVPRCMSESLRQEYFSTKEIPDWCYQASKYPLKPRRFGIFTGPDQSKIDGGQQKRMSISYVVPGLPAQVAGLREGDVIVTIGGVQITDNASLSREMDRVPANGEARFTVLRGRKQITVIIKPRF